MPLQSNWILPDHPAISADLKALIGSDRIVGEALIRRGITQYEQARAFLNSDFYMPANPADLPDLEKAVERILKALRARERIGIWGDFDVDGQTSTTLLVSALRLAGARVEYHIPIRSEESHGITLPKLNEFIKKGIDLFITCDTGITALDAVLECRRLKVDMIITDHHTLGESLPEAFAVVNPQRLNPGHALSYLCGVGCAFELIRHLYTSLGRESQTNQFLDLVTLGTVADIALLKGDNRYLVQKGLQLLQTNPRPSLKAILSLADTNFARLTEEHIGFLLGPRMNAIGRLSDANPMVNFLMSNEPDEIAPFALRLEKWNNERKMLCDQVFKAALSQVESNRSLLDEPILVLDHPNWPAGIVGIVASRLVELYHRPCILLVTPQDGIARGSARSVEGINITQAIAAQKDLLVGFGGHAMAAGLAIQPDQLAAFRNAISRYIRNLKVDTNRPAPVRIDAWVPLQDITLNLVESISRLAPFGAGNPALTLAASDLIIRAKNVIGKTGEHLKLVVEDSSGTSAPVIWWQGAGSPLPEGKFNLAYTVRTSDYKGSPQLQIEWLDYQDAPEPSITLQESPLNVDWADYRLLPPPPDIWQQILVENPAIWAEGKVSSELNAVNRLNLQPNPFLVVWNIPPGPQEFKQALEAVHPARIVLLGNITASDQPVNFLRDLASMSLFAIHKKGGWFDINLAAAVSGHRPAAIIAGIKWLCAKGQISILQQPSLDRVQLVETGTPDPRLANVETELKIILRETDAYRQYYLRARPELILSGALKFIPT
jgi:single-stranded-DNA-specific exonuclease